MGHCLCLAHLSKDERRGPNGEWLGYAARLSPALGALCQSHGGEGEEGVGGVRDKKLNFVAFFAFEEAEMGAKFSFLSLL